jgi:hypothetical protein
VVLEWNGEAAGWGSPQPRWHANPAESALIRTGFKPDLDPAGLLGSRAGQHP